MSDTGWAQVTVCARCGERHGIGEPDAESRRPFGLIGCWVCGDDESPLRRASVLARNLRADDELPMLLELMPPRAPPVILYETFGIPNPFLSFLQENLPEEEDE